jgi:hypothetical protein
LLVKRESQDQQALKALSEDREPKVLWVVQGKQGLEGTKASVGHKDSQARREAKALLASQAP